MEREIRDRHFTRKQKRDDAREQTDHREKTADELEHTAESDQRKQLQIVVLRLQRNVKNLGGSVHHEQEPCHDAQHAQDARRPRLTQDARFSFRKAMVRDQASFAAASS